MFQDLFTIEPCGQYSDKVRKLGFQRSRKIKPKSITELERTPT